MNGGFEGASVEGLDFSSAALLDAGGGGGTATSGMFPPVFGAVDGDAVAAVAAIDGDAVAAVAAVDGDAVAAVAVAGWEDNALPEPDILILYLGISSAPVELLPPTSSWQLQAVAQAIL